MCPRALFSIMQALAAGEVAAGARKAERELQHVLWRAVMFILALVGIGVNALIFVILGGHGHSHHGHSHDHRHSHGHSHEHSHGKGSGCNGNTVRPLCPLHVQLAALNIYTWISCQIMSIALQPCVCVCPGLTPRRAS